jgi:hypothetical protein
MVLGRSNPQKLYFLHVPKCGGTSIDAALRARYHPTQVFRLPAAASALAAELFFDDDEPRDQYSHVLRYREALLLYAMASGDFRYIAGHFCFSETAFLRFGDEFAHITVLRDPVERWLSHYFFNRYKGEQNTHCRVDEELSAALASDEGRSWGTEYVKFYGGVVADGDYRSRTAIQHAIHNLTRFYSIGVLENLGRFTDSLRRSFGIRIRVPKKNISPVSTEFRERLVTPEVLDRLQEICGPDIEVYQSVISRQ